MDFTRTLPHDSDSMRGLWCTPRAIPGNTSSKRSCFVCRTSTFFWRAGDLLSSVAVLVFITWLRVSVQAFTFVNILAVGVWLGLAAFLAKRNRRMTAEAERAAA